MTALLPITCPHCQGRFRTFLTLKHATLCPRCQRGINTFTPVPTPGQWRKQGARVLVVLFPIAILLVWLGEQPRPVTPGPDGLDWALVFVLLALLGLADHIASPRVIRCASPDTAAQIEADPLPSYEPLQSMRQPGLNLCCPQCQSQRLAYAAQWRWALQRLQADTTLAWVPHSNPVRAIGCLSCHSLFAPDETPIQPQSGGLTASRLVLSAIKVSTLAFYLISLLCGFAVWNRVLPVPHAGVFGFKVVLITLALGFWLRIDNRQRWPVLRCWRRIGPVRPQDAAAAP